MVRAHLFAQRTALVHNRPWNFAVTVEIARDLASQRQDKANADVRLRSSSTDSQGAKEGRVRGREAEAEGKAERKGVRRWDSGVQYEGGQRKRSSLCVAIRLDESARRPVSVEGTRCFGATALKSSTWTSGSLEISRSDGKLLGTQSFACVRPRRTARKRGREASGRGESEYEIRKGKESENQSTSTKTIVYTTIVALPNGWTSVEELCERMGEGRGWYSIEGERETALNAVGREGLRLQTFVSRSNGCRRCWSEGIGVDVALRTPDCNEGWGTGRDVDEDSGYGLAFVGRIASKTSRRRALKSVKYGFALGSLVGAKEGFEGGGGCEVTCDCQGNSVDVRICTTTQTHTEIEAKTYEDEREFVRDHKLLGNFNLVGIPPYRLGVSLKLNFVAFDIDPDADTDPGNLSHDTDPRPLPHCCRRQLSTPAPTMVCDGRGHRQGSVHDRGFSLWSFGHGGRREGERGARRLQPCRYPSYSTKGGTGKDQSMTKGSSSGLLEMAVHGGAREAEAQDVKAARRRIRGLSEDVEVNSSMRYVGLSRVTPQLRMGYPRCIGLDPRADRGRALVYGTKGVSIVALFSKVGMGSRTESAGASARFGNPFVCQGFEAWGLALGSQGLADLTDGYKALWINVGVRLRIRNECM
ncbi:hypothetical protein NMY22_g7174 [Coprinellus aureogranulatus]|nr:hypothetical protein NMY22_g7174 [Coprinellus aureogranulatus]